MITKVATSQNWKKKTNTATGFQKNSTFSLTCSQILANSSCGWSPLHFPHKSEKEKTLIIDDTLISCWWTEREKLPEKEETTGAGGKRWSSVSFAFCCCKKFRCTPSIGEYWKFTVLNYTRPGALVITVCITERRTH